MEETYHYIILIGVGFVVGFINAIAGGGALISLPVLIFLGLPPAVANGTNRVGVIAQMALASIGYKSKGVSTFPFNIYMGIAALLGAIIGANFAVDIKGENFNKVLAIVMILVVLTILFKPKIKVENLQERLSGKYLWFSVFGFFFIGIYGGFINAGVGFAVIFLLHFVNKMSLVRANATKAVAILIYTLSALVIFTINSMVNWHFGLILATGNGLGAFVSSRFSVVIGEGYVRYFMVIVICVLAFKLWFF